MFDVFPVIASILRILAFILFYMFIGFAPGFIIGVVLANVFFARHLPVRFDLHDKRLKESLEHNKKWHPDDPRWQ